VEAGNISWSAKKCDICTSTMQYEEAYKKYNATIEDEEH
jgi:hypothetical protein